MAHHHWSDTPTSPRAVLHHTDANLCTILHTTVPIQYELVDCKVLLYSFFTWYFCIYWYSKSFVHQTITQQHLLLDENQLSSNFQEKFQRVTLQYSKLISTSKIIWHCKFDFRYCLTALWHAIFRRNFEESLFLHSVKVIYPKYSKHWPYTVAHTIYCVYRKC